MTVQLWHHSYPEVRVAAGRVFTRGGTVQVVNIIIVVSDIIVQMVNIIIIIL